MLFFLREYTRKSVLVKIIDTHEILEYNLEYLLKKQKMTLMKHLLPIDKDQ